MTTQQLIIEINQMPLLDKIQIMEWVAKAIQKDALKELKKDVVVELTEKEKAIAIIKAGCDMSNFGDAAVYQRENRKDRILPFREEV
jgi:hypothetical protein